MAKLSSTSNSSLKKLLLKMASFVIIILIVDFVAGTILGKLYFSIEGKHTKINYVLKQRKDVVVFGSSRALRHYIPDVISKEIGYKVINAGDDAKNSTYQLALLNLMLDQYTPKIIVYEIGSVAKRFDNCISDVYPYYYRNAKIRELIKKHDRFAPLRFLSHSYAYNQKIFWIVSSSISKGKQKNDGYDPLYGTIRSQELKQSYEYLEWVDDPNFDETISYNFKEFIRLCNEKNIKLVFVCSPLFFGDYPKFTYNIDKIATANHIQFFHYVNDQRFAKNTKLFKDPMHLNNDGAIMFSEIFGKDLQRYLQTTQVKN